jgi:hypothetical protein
MTLPNLPYSAWARDVNANWSTASNWRQATNEYTSGNANPHHVAPQADEVALLNPFDNNGNVPPFAIIDDITTTIAGVQISEPRGGSSGKTVMETLQIGNGAGRVTLTVTGGITYHYPAPHTAHVVHDSRNLNIIHVTSVGTLNLGGDLDNRGGAINVDSGGIVNFTGPNVAKGETTATVNDGTLTIAAGGIVDATGAGQATILTNVKVTDNGTLAATGGSTLDLQGATVTGTGNINATGAGSLVKLDGASIVGTLESNSVVGVTFGASGGGIIETVVGATATVLKNGTTIAAGATLTVVDGSALALSGTITNGGEIFLDATGTAGADATNLVVRGNVQLTGGGQVVMSDDAKNGIVGNAATKLTNIDNTISGAGHIGNGTVGLTFVNDGTIDATGTNSLEINISAGAFTNKATIGAQGTGHLIVDGTLANPGGTIAASGGTVTILGAETGGAATIAGGSIEFGSSGTAATTFTSSIGTLRLDDALDFKGTVAGLAGDGSGGNVIDFAGIALTQGTTAFHENAAGTSGRLVLSDGTNTANLALLGNYISTINPAPGSAGFVVASDGHNGTQVSYIAPPAV